MAYAGLRPAPTGWPLHPDDSCLLIYALLGTARHVSVGPTSATAALLASSVAVSLVAVPVASALDSAQMYQAYASAFVLVTGGVFLVAGLARLGFVTQFLSKPVMDGFVVGLAFFVVVGQLNKLFGVVKPGMATPSNGSSEYLSSSYHRPTGSRRRSSECHRRPLPAAPVERENPGRPCRALRSDHPEQCRGPRGPVRRRRRRRAAPGPAERSPAGCPHRRRAGHGAPGDRGAPGRVQRGATGRERSAEKHGYEVDADQELRAHAVGQPRERPLRGDHLLPPACRRRRSRRAPALARRPPTSSPGWRRS